MAAGLTAGQPALSATADEITADGKKIVVVDGDTIQIGGRLLALAGLDAPEVGQVCKNGDRLWMCGLDAAHALRKLLTVQIEPVVCRITGRGGALEQAACRAGERDVGEAMAATGQTTVLPDATTSLLAAEVRARKAGLGIWRGEFVAPAAWRQGERMAAENAAEASTARWDHFPYTMLGVRVLPVPRVHLAGCLVRARETADGVREFAGPLDPSYDRFPADRTFCSDDEAGGSGWLHVGQVPASYAVARN